MVAEIPLAEGVRHAAPGDSNPQVERETSAAPVQVDTPPSRQNPGSVQRLLEKEGHDARNVVSWLVPNRTGGGGSGGSLVFDARTGGCSAPRGERGDRDGQEVSRERDIGRRKSSPIASPLKGSSSSMSSKGTPGYKVRSGSDSTAHGFNQRLWGYLFRNVNRAVDELYYLCEAECSATHCTEAAELLEGCSRDFTKLVERIAAQTRFEEEQRAARAAERAGPEGELGGDSSAESGGRKPKGLVWEVRKTTSASTASAMVLTAIERMESHHGAPRGGGIPRVAPVAPPCAPPRATSSLKLRSPESGATGSCGGGEEMDGVAASGAVVGCGRKNEEQRIRDSRKGTEECCRASSCDVGFVATIDENLDVGIGRGAGGLGGPASVSRLELNDGVEDGDEGTVPRVGSAVPGDGGGDDTTAPDGSLATRRGGQSIGGCVGAGAFNVDPGDGHRTRACRADGHDGEGEGGRSVKRRPEEDGREGAEGTRAKEGREKKQANQVIGPHPSCGHGCGCAETPRTGSDRSTVATVLEADDSKGKENTFREQQRVASAAAPADDAAASAREENERKSATDSRRPSSLTDPQKNDILSSGDADTGTRRGSTAPTVAPRTRPCGSRLNPRAAPFTYNPGERRASARVSYANPTLPGCAGETRRSERTADVNVAPAVLAMNAGAAPPRSLPPTTTTTTPASTASCPTTVAAKAASAGTPYDPNVETWMGGSDAEVLPVADSSVIGGAGPWPRIKHTVPLPPRTPSPPTGHHSDAAASQRPLRPRSSGRSRSLSGGYADVDAARAAAGVSEDGNVLSASNNGYSKPRETKERNPLGGVSAPLTLLPPESKWTRRPKLTPDCATATSADNRTTSGRPARKFVPGASQRDPHKTTPPRDSRVPYPPKLCNVGSKSGNVGVAAAALAEGAAAGGGRGNDGLPLTGQRAWSPGAEGVPIEKRGRLPDDPAPPRAVVAARGGERSPDSKDGGGDGVSGEYSAMRARTDTRATCPIRKLDQRRRPGVPMYAAGGIVSSPGGFGGGGGNDDDAAGTDDAGVATETDCCEGQDPDSVYVMEMERIWAEAEALVDAEAQAEEEAWARLPTEVPCPSESEEVTSDVEDACQFARATESGGAGRNEGGGLQTDPRDDAPPDPHPSDLEIVIPALAESVGVEDEEEEASSSLSGGRRRGVEDDQLGETKGLGLEDADPDYHPVLEDTNAEDQDKAISSNSNSNSREEDVNERLARCAGGSPSGNVLVGLSGRGGPCHKSPGSPAGALLGGASGGCCYDSAAPRSEAESSSEVSCFGNERGSCSHETIDEGWAALSYRELQKKLSSPQRKPQRKLLSAAEAKLRQERRQMVAELNRAQLASGMAEKLKQQEERARGVRFRKEEQLMRAEEEARKRMESADARRLEHRRGIVRKANDANSKVKEVLFMNKLTVEDLKITLQMQLSEVDRRIQSGRARRQRLLAGISDRQKKRTKDKAAQMSERRLEAEEAAAMRWEALQKRLEAVQERRRDRELETRRRMQAADRHRQARERREAMLQQHHGGAGKTPQRRQQGADGKSEAESPLASQEAKERRPGVEASTTNQSSRPPPSRGCDGSVAPAGKGCKDCTEGHIGAVGDSIGVGVGANVLGANACPASLLPPSGGMVTDGRLAPRGGGGWQKRSRGQKKRAKKIKDKLRQLCLEAATETSASAASAAAGSTAGAFSHGAEETEIRTEASNPRVSSLGGSRSACGGETNDGSGEKHQRVDHQGKPCPGLARAVEDLAALTRAYERCCQIPPAPRPKQSVCSELGMGLLRAADWSDVPNASLPRPEKRSLAGADAVVSPPLSLGSPEPSKAEGGAHESGPSCMRIASATSFVGPVGSDGKLSPPVCQPVRDGNSGGGAVGTSLPAEDVGRGENVSVEKPQQGEEEDVPVGEGGASAFGDDGAPGGGKALPLHKKTRRGKRSGAATTKRRGHKASAKARGVGENMAHVDRWGGDGNDPHVGERRGLEEEAAMEAEVVPPASSSRDGGAQGGKHRSQAGDGDRGENSWSGSSRRRNSERVSANVVALECAALRSLRNLRPALPAATTFRGKTGLRASGILESLVEICAPASWNPVPLLVGAASSVLPSPTGRSPAHHHGSSLKLSFNGGEEAERDGGGREKDRKDGGCPVIVSRNGLRDAVTGAALAILRRVLEEPENRDRLLRVDGAAPLVDCLARLLERAVRPGMNTPPHSSSAARPVLMPEAEAGDARLATTDTSPLDDSSRQNGMKKQKPSVCGDGDKGDARTTSKTGGVDKVVRRTDGVTVYREAVCGPEEEDENGEEALMEALGVVALLIRHESAPADDEDGASLRIQDELLRYLAAKRLMSDLAVLLSRLHPRCGDEDTILGDSSGRKKGSPCVGDSGVVQPSGLAPAAAASTIQLHLEACGSASDHRRSRKRCRQSFPLARLVAGIAELADAVLSYPLRARRPHTPSSSTMALPPVQCRPSSDPGTQNESPPINGRGENHRSPGGADVLSSKPRCRRRRGSEEGLGVCRSLEDLRQGYAAARPEFCGVVREDPGSTRVVVELLSLVAAMAETGEGTQRAPERGDGSAPGARETLALSDALLRLASLVVRAANHAFVIDLSQMQESLSAKDVRHEFTSLCDGLLRSLVEKVESQVLTSPNSRLTEAEESLEWVVRLLGGFALGNRKNQEVLQWGSPPTILGRLCNLPFRYFLEPQLQAVLFPTLISICHENVTNRDAVENDLSRELLASFLEDNRGGYYQCHEKQRRQGPDDDDDSRNTVKDHAAGDFPWIRFSLRFPLDLWEPAIDFLSDPKKQSRELSSEGAPRA